MAKTEAEILESMDTLIQEAKEAGVHIVMACNTNKNVYIAYSGDPLSILGLTVGLAAYIKTKFTLLWNDREIGND